MKILVSIKRVPDPYSRIRLKADGRIDTAGVAWVINPFDEIALEEAVRLRERGAPAEIVVVSIGGLECEEQLKTALAMGADRALLVADKAQADEVNNDEVNNEWFSDPSVVSRLLAAVCRAEKPDLILMGKQAIDDDCSQTAQRLAALLNLPQATSASTIELTADGKHARVTREVDVGREVVEVTLPAVVTADLRLNEPRYVALPAILRARSKPLQRIDAAELGPSPAAKVHITRMESPPQRKAGRRVESVDELAAIISKAAGRS